MRQNSSLSNIYGRNRLGCTNSQHLQPQGVVIRPNGFTLPQGAVNDSIQWRELPKTLYYYLVVIYR